MGHKITIDSSLILYMLPHSVAKLIVDETPLLVFPADQYLSLLLIPPLAQVGDLAASAIKRNHEIKDYGKLIPGHGGIMDRFDSVIFTAPITYFLITILMNGHG